jgi:hypothetical protein
MKTPNYSNKPGKYGHYYGYAPNEPDSASVITVYLTSSDISVSSDRQAIYIEADSIAGFVTELIEMARVLGVTGEMKGNE